MIWYVIFGFFAAVGVLFLLWLMIGAFLPAGCECVLAVCCRPGSERAVTRRYRWLRELGILHGSLIILNSDLPLHKQEEFTQHYPGVRFTTAEQWLAERK